MISRRPNRASQRALTLLEVLVAIGILAMISLLLYGAFDGLSRSRGSLNRLQDRHHQGRAAIRRIAQELSSAFLTLHQPNNPNMQVRQTVFIAKDTSPADRLDMTTFSHRRVNANSRESDQNELSYFGSPDPLVSGKIDLARREQPVIDIEPQKGGAVYVMVEDIDLFDLKFLDAQSGIWVDTWDSTQVIGQPMRLPLQVRVTLVLKGGAGGRNIRFEEKVPLPIQNPLSFAIPK